MLGKIGLLFAGYLYTQRNPDRTPDSNQGVLSPADGIVLSVDNKDVQIYMNIFNVHVQRSPLAGTVKSIIEHDGDTGFCNSKTGCPEFNKYILTTLETEYEDIEIIQKAGGIFSNPISFLQVGQKIERGEVIGKITFGSGCSTTIPNNFNIVTKVGDKVYAGQTIIAEEVS